MVSIVISFVRVLRLARWRSVSARPLVVPLVLGVAVLSSPIARAADPVEPLVVHRVEAGFDDLRDRIVFAIEGRGLTVGHVARIGEMLDRTGRDLGIADRTFAEAEVIEFCASQLTREVTAIDPRYVAYCPYAITVYSLVSDPGHTYLAYRRPLPPVPGGPLADALAKAEALLSGIANEALE